MNAPKVRASLIEMWTRVVPEIRDGDKTVYWNGEDNLYPSEIENLINNSPTASRSAILMGKYVAGAGVSVNGVLQKYSDLEYVNKKKAYKITDIIRIASQNIGKQYGVWFKIEYGINENGDIVPTSIDILEYAKCRKVKEDDEQNPGKILYKDFCEKRTIGGKKKNARWYYPFNKDPKVVLAQIKTDAGKESDLTKALKKYRGQVFYLNLTPQYQYALSRVDSAYNDADTEYRMGLYSNTQTRSGFLGKTLVLTAGLDAEDNEALDKDIAVWLGGENSGNIQRFSFEAGTDLTKAVVVQQLKPQFDDKLFVESDKRIRRNIMGAFNNIPEALVNAGEGALFGTSSDTYREMKLFYSEQVEEEREKLQETLTMLGFPVIIEPIVKPDPVVSKPITPTEDVQ